MNRKMIIGQIRNSGNLDSEIHIALCAILQKGDKPDEYPA